MIIMCKETLYTNDSIRKSILHALLGEKPFSEFTFNKGDTCIYKYDQLGWFRISIANSWSSVDINRESRFSLCISPGYSRRFTVLHKWYEPFVKDSIKENRKNASVMMGHNVESGYFDFLRSGEEFDSDYAKLKDAICLEALPFFRDNMSLDLFYRNNVLPSIQGKREFRKDTVIWVYEWLMATRIVAQESYDKTKRILTDYLYNSPFPISRIFRSAYEAHFDEVISVLESYDYNKDLKP